VATEVEGDSDESAVWDAVKDDEVEREAPEVRVLERELLAETEGESELLGEEEKLREGEEDGV